MVVVVVVSFFVVMIVLKGKITYIYNVSSNGSGSIDISDTSNSKTETKTKFITFLIQEEDCRRLWMIMIYYSKIMGHDTRREDKYL